MQMIGVYLYYSRQAGKCQVSPAKTPAPEDRRLFFILAADGEPAAIPADPGKPVFCEDLCRDTLPQQGIGERFALLQAAAGEDGFVVAQDFFGCLADAIAAVRAGLTDRIAGAGEGDGRGCLLQIVDDACHLLHKGRTIALSLEETDAQQVVRT